MARSRRERSPTASGRRTVRQRRGQIAEGLARALLERSGYEVIAANVRFRVGELDLIAREGQVLCFVEVRSTTTDQFGPAIASITDRKRRHLIRAAQWYLMRLREQPVATRFDVVTIDWREDRAAAIELIRGAFTADW